MQTQWFNPPMRGSFLKDDAKEGEIPLRECLVLAFDDHSENYLVADHESGEQRWLTVQDVQIDCEATMRPHTGEDEKEEEPKGDPCPVCKRPMPEDD